MSFHDRTSHDSKPFDAEEQVDRVRQAGWGDCDLTLLGSNRRPAPAFPADLLGPFWSAWVQEAADASSSPPDYPGCALLAAAGAALANVRRPMAGAGWDEPPVLWMCLVGSPSSGKSPAMDRVTRLVRHAEDHMAAGFEDELREYETKKASAEAHLKVWRNDMDAYAKSPVGSPPDKPAAAEMPDEPQRPRIAVSDATIEKLAVLAASLPRGLILSRDELAGWVAAFDRYGGNGSDRAFYLEAYGGRGYTVDRMKNPEPIRVRHLSVGICGTTQPDRLGLITSGADDGLSSRFLWCWPDVVPGFTLARKAFDDLSAQYAINRLTTVPMGSDTFGKPAPAYLRLEDAAENVIEEFGREMAARADAVSGAFGGSLGKARGHVLRLSAIIEHLWWCGESGPQSPQKISTASVKRACALVGGYFVPMAERVYGDAAIPEDERNAMMIAKRLRQDRASHFNARTIGRELTVELRNGRKMDAACEVLIDHGLIRKAEVGDEHKGRRPKNYDVHPAVWRRS